MLANQSTFRRRRRAFTLVEVLIVITIIGILAALILPAINSAMRTARNTAEYGDITQLGLALEEFKNRFGVYPPSRIRLREGSAYDVNNQPFDAHSVKWLRRVWPDLQLPGDDHWIIWCRDDPAKTEANRQARSGYAPQVYELEGDECLVFFLGGIAEFERDPGTGKEVPGRPIILHGFTDNPRNPGGVPDASNAATMARIDPFFDFDASRLLIRTPISSVEDDDAAEFFDFDSQRPRPNNKLPSYRSRLSPPDTETPYAYFSSYDGTGYRANDCNFIDEPAIPFQERWPTVTTSSTPHPFSPGPNPYTVTEAAPPNDSNVSQAYEPRKYQIIAPGPDGEYGAGGSLGVATVELTEADKDNISNVTEGIAIGEHHRVNAK